ncbi:uncharacterized protein LOC124363212 isoform X2 [Homalodisca vitripennis]|uniref:uncharacterized protein LOC124363212 isoform X2 n=1 Tax=Homalodisca vitripennis TaxID=197043 RepID=UPI001EEB050B|nr:uncharacterized protein LOC124363212 isoform X2 [Homalodisca vitripennis]
MEAEGSDLRNLIQVFYEVSKFCEGVTGSTDAEFVFKSAQIVENTCSKFESLGALEDFESKLNQFWELKGLNGLPIQFYKKAVNEVLRRYITDCKFSDNDVQCAINKFLLIRSREDFVEVIKHLSDTHRSIELLKRNCSPTEILKYNAEILLCDLTKQLIRTNGNIEELNSTIVNIFSENRDSVKIFVRVLCLTDKCELSQCVQNVIAINISNYLGNPENITEFSYILELDDKDFSDIIVRWKPLPETFMNIIEISVEHLKCNYTESSYSWEYSGSEKGLPFEMIITLINKLKPVPEMSDSIKELLHRSKEKGFEIIVEDIFRICKLR